MSKLYINPLPVRLWHWANAVLFIVLVVTGVQIRYLDLFDSLRPPRLRNAPVISPTAKNAKYMRAAGCSTTLLTRGGRLKSTVSRLCTPINTNKRNTAVTNTILINVIALIRL